MPEHTPTEWKYYTLGEIAQINPRENHQGLSENTEVSFVPMASVSEITASIVTAETRHFQEVRKGFTPFREGDILFAKITPCMENGKVAIARNLVNGVGFGSTEFHVIRPISEVSTRLIWYFLRNPGTREYAAKNMTGSAGQRRVPANFLSNLSIMLPVIKEEQERIADLLDEVDAARHLSSEINQEMEKLSNAFFIDVFGDPETNPKGWNVVSLGDPQSVVGFTYGTNAKCTEQPIGIPVLRIPNILRGKIDLQDLKYADLPAKERQKLSLQIGDVLVVRSNGNPDYIGRGAAYKGIPDEVAYASYLIRIRPVPTAFDGEYLSAWLRSSNGRRQLFGQAKTTAGQYNLSTEGLRQLVVPKPPLLLQKEFVAVLDELQSWSQMQEEQHKALDEMLHSLLNRIFTGQLSSNLATVAGRSPTQSQAPSNRIIWPKLSITQRSLWEISQTFTEPFKVEDLSEKTQVQLGKVPNREYVISTMELFDTLGVTIKENRTDLDKWRCPDVENDPEVEI